MTKLKTRLFYFNVTIKLSINNKSCTTFTTDVQNVRRLKQHKLQEGVYREKILTVEELQQRIMQEWERLDQRVIDNVVKQWRMRLQPSMLVSLQTADIFNTFAYNAEFYCHMN